eukprot:5222480-Prymnesium_polylepis.2
MSRMILHYAHPAQPLCTHDSGRREQYKDAHGANGAGNGGASSACGRGTTCTRRTMSFIMKE